MKKGLIIAGICIVAAAAAAVAVALLIPKKSPEPGNYQEIKKYLGREEEWYGTDEAVNIADAIVAYQLSDGGWRKDWANPTVEGSWAKSTVDNDGTTSEITVLAKVYNQTKKGKYKSACIKGIKLLLNGQYENGGWPQVFDDPGTYHAHITYNDYAMVHILRLLTDVSNRDGDFSFVSKSMAQKAKAAVEGGIKCILDTQIEVRGVKTAWCQQYDENTLQPAQARAYEYPSICAAESTGIVEFLMEIPEKTPEIEAAISSAIEWLRDSRLYGIKFVSQGDDKVVVEDPNAEPIWARFYEIETNRPMFADRDGSIHYDVSEISKERRTGYAWYGSWPKNLVKD